MIGVKPVEHEGFIGSADVLSDARTFMVSARVTPDADASRHV